jgi:hypothetical protein
MGKRHFRSHIEGVGDDFHRVRLETRTTNAPGGSERLRPRK